MAPKNRLKRAANLVQAPPDAAAADIWLARIGTLMRERAAVQSALDERVTEARQLAEAKTTPIDAEIATLTAGLQLWAEANRERLTDGHRRKFVELAAGRLLWRTRPPSVRLRDVAAVLEELKQRQLVQFIRTKEEIDKDAMLRDRVVARAVPGVTIGSEGEEFVVEPVTEALPASAGGVA